MLGEVQLCDAAARCLEAATEVERAPAKDEDKVRRADESFVEFTAALARIEEYFSQATDQEMVQNSGAVLLHTFKNRGAAELPMLLVKVREVPLEIDAHRQRQLALLNAAISAKRATEIADMLGVLGMTNPAWTEQRAGGELLGYVVEAVRLH